MRRRPPEHTRTDTRFPSTTLFRSTVQDRRRIVAISRGEPAAYRRGAALFGLHVCRGRQLYRARLAHLRFPLHPLSARLGDLGARDGDLCQFLCAPLAARHSLAALRGNRSEEHTSELQSLLRISYAVFCLKKKKRHNRRSEINNTT